MFSYARRQSNISSFYRFLLVWESVSVRDPWFPNFLSIFFYQLEFDNFFCSAHCRMSIA